MYFFGQKIIFGEKKYLNLQKQKKQNCPVAKMDMAWPIYKI